MAVAMADGSLHDLEGAVLKKWVIRKIDPFPNEQKSALKELYNQAMKDAFQELRSGEMSLNSVTKRLNKIGELPIKQEAIDLCFEVLRADGVGDGCRRRFKSVPKWPVKSVPPLQNTGSATPQISRPERDVPTPGLTDKLTHIGKKRVRLDAVNHLFFIR